MSRFGFGCGYCLVFVCILLFYGSWCGLECGFGCWICTGCAICGFDLRLDSVVFRFGVID